MEKRKERELRETEVKNQGEQPTFSLGNFAIADTR